MADLATLKIAVDSRDAQRNLEDLGGALGVVESLAKRVAAAFAAYKLADAVKDAAMLAARYETLGVVMGVVGNNAGYTSKQMDGFAKGLEKTGIAMVEARSTLTQMAQAQIDLNKSQQLARIAQDAAVIGNLNSSEAFQRMITGIQSGQVEILRTIGLNVNFEKSYEALAKQLKKQPKDLTESEKSMARVNVVMEKGKDIAGAYEAAMGTAGKQINSMKRYVDNLEVSIGQVFGPLLTFGVEQATGALKTMSEWVEKNRIGLTASSMHLAEAGKNFAGMIADAIGMGSALGNITEEITFAEIGAAGLSSVIAIMRDIFNVILGTVQMIVQGIAALVSNLLRGVATLFGMTPPKWLSAWADSSAASAERGMARLNSGFYGEAYGSLGMAPSHTSQAVDDTAEKARIKAAKDRKDQEAADAKAKKAAEDLRKEYERQIKVVMDLRNKLADLGATELQVMYNQIAAQGLTGKQRDEALKLAREISLKKTMLEIEKERLQVENERERAARENGLRMLLDAEDSRARDMQDRLSGERRYNQGMAYEFELKQIQRLKLSQESFSKAMFDLRYQFSDTFRVLADGMLNFGDNLARSFGAWIAKMDGAKFVFKDLVRSMMADIATMFAQEAMRKMVLWALGGISSWSGWGGGSTQQSFGAAPQMSPSGGYMGYTPSANAGGVVVNVAVNQGGGASVQTQGGAGDMSKLGDLIGNRVREVMVNEMRPGGLLSPA